MKDILIVEDDAMEGRLLQKDLRAVGFKVTLVSSLQSAKNFLLKESADIILADFQLPDGNGNQLLKWAGVHHMGSIFFLMSAFGTIHRAVEAIKLGAKDFFEKPINREFLISNIQKQFSRKDSAFSAHYNSQSDYRLMGISPKFKEAVRLAEIASTKTCNILLHGESGTGKEVLARYIHHLSNCGNSPFIGVNCTAIPDTLFESEMFGHKKGAFTGAERSKPGKLVQAEGGTLFLDEIGDMPLQIQTKLLRVLQEKRVIPLGGNKEISLDFRLICATHQELNKLVEKGLFREDLYYRIHVLEICLPPLRQRPEDIPLLLQKFLLSHMNEMEAKKEIERLPNFLTQYSWPGNVRELKNAAERYAILKQTGLTWPEILPKSPKAAAVSHSQIPCGKIPTFKHVADKEILRALEICGFHRRKTAEYLNITRRALQYRLSTLKNLAR